MKRYWIDGIFVVVLILFGFFAFDGKSREGIITRSFEKNIVSPGEVIEVNLNIKLGKGQDYYLFEENAPDGVSVLGDIAKENRIRQVEIQGAESGVFSYKIKSPAEKRVYIFSGEYGMQGIDGVKSIYGEDRITVA